MKNNTTTQIIAKEGIKYIAFFFVVFLISLYVDFLPWVFFAIMAFTVFIFRNPERLPNEDDEFSLLAPCDGKVSDIKKVKLNEKEYVKIQIDKSIFNVALLRSPTKLNIINTKKRNGLFLPVTSSLSKKLAQSVMIECESKFGQILINIIAGTLARKIELFKTIGPLKSASRFGLLVDGSVELYISLDTRIKVSIGDEVKAGESVLGYFAHKGNDIE
ncbi:phosphatidylserine decarboxylase [Sulfurospirillum sp. 1307]|jgi:phosphatidylserine decarboxylase